MKGYYIGILFLLTLLFASPAYAASSHYCSTDCLTSYNVLMSTESLYGGMSGIVYDDTLVSSNEYFWTSGKTVDFSLSYDAKTKLLVYDIDGKVSSLEVTTDDGFKNLILIGQTSTYGGNGIFFSNLQLNTESLPKLNVNIGTRGLLVALDDNSFLFDGKVMMNTDANTNAEMAGMKIFLTDAESRRHSRSSLTVTTNNSTNNETTEDDEREGGDDTLDTEAVVPEFGVVAAAIALVGSIGIFMLKKK